MYRTKKKKTEKNIIITSNNFKSFERKPRKPIFPIK